MTSSLPGEALQSLSYSIPSRHGMAALHPSEHPRNGAQVLQAPALGPARWPRANARRIQFQDRRGLLEILQYVRVLRDVAAINAISLPRHFLHRLFPPRLILWRSGRARERFQARGNHQFQIPFREHGIGVLPIENFSLLGNADASGKTAFRLGQDRRVRRTASAPDRAAATVKKAQLHSAFS